MRASDVSGAARGRGTLNAGVSAHTVLNFVLRNRGNATAFDVRARVVPACSDVAESAEPEPDETGHEISLWPPGQSLASKGMVPETTHDEGFEVTTTWSQKPGERTHEVVAYFIKGKELPDEAWTMKGLHAIAEELEQMRKQLPKA